MIFPAIFLLAGALFYGSQLLEYLTSPYFPTEFKIVMLAVPAIYFLYVAYRAFIHPGEPRRVVFRDESFILPESPNSKLDEEVRYEDVQAILAVSRGPMQSVVVDYGGGTTMLGSGDFEREDAPALLRRELMRRIRNLPNAAEVLERLEEQEERSRELSRRPNRATMIMLGVIAVAFGFQTFVGGLETTTSMIRWGAAAPFLIDDGQYFRLVAANLYHGGWVHIILNGVALFFLGTVVEKLTDKWTLIFVTLLSGVLGVAASWLLTEPWPYAVGSSAAIYGLFGAFGVIHLKYGKDMPPLYRQSKMWWFVIIALNAGLSFGITMVDEWAHMGGLVVGALATWLALMTREGFDLDKGAPAWVKVLAYLMIAVFVGGTAWTAAYAVDEHPEDVTRAYEALASQSERGKMDPLTVNEVAFKRAISDDVSVEQLRLLQDAIEAALETDRDPQIVDTLATLEYRRASLLDDPDQKRDLYRDAIDRQIGVLGDSKSDSVPEIIRKTGPTFATQLARFLDAHRKDFGPWKRTDVDGMPSFEFIPKGDGQLEVDWESRESEVRVLVVAKSEGELEGLVQICFDGDATEMVIEDKESFEEWPNDLRLYPATSTTRPTSATEQVEYWEAVSDVVEYP